MESGGQHRGQYGHSSFPRGYAPDASARSVTTTGIQNVVMAHSLEGGDNFRQTQMTTSQPATSAAMSVNANTRDISSFGPYPAPPEYAPPQLQGPASSFQYQSQYAQETQRQQPYPPQYTSQLIYGVPQQQAPHQSQYGPVPQYQPRHSVTAEVLSNDFGVSQYYNPGAGGRNSTPTAVIPQYPTAPYQQQLPYSATADPERSTLVSPYPGTEPEAAQPQTSASAEPEQRQPDRYDVLYDQYRRVLRETNENASRGRLVQAGESLLEISDWLLSNAEGLELTKDNQAARSDRLKLWKDFNYCWLAFLTRQLDDTKTMQATGQRPAPGQSVLSKAAVQRLGDELIRLCDGLEKSGLVDYEMGVWEEEIITLLLQCREVASDGNRRSATAEATQTSRKVPGTR